MRFVSRSQAFKKAVLKPKFTMVQTEQGRLSRRRLGRMSNLIAKIKKWLGLDKGEPKNP